MLLLPVVVVVLLLPVVVVVVVLLLPVQVNSALPVVDTKGIRTPAHVTLKLKQLQVSGALERAYWSYWSYWANSISS